MRKGIEYGKPNAKEKALIRYLGECLAKWVENNPTERSELLCALTAICSLMFTHKTPIQDVDKQCEEIDAFCECLKLRARDSK